VARAAPFGGEVIAARLALDPRAPIRRSIFSFERVAFISIHTTPSNPFQYRMSGCAKPVPAFARHAVDLHRQPAEQGLLTEMSGLERSQ